MIGSPLPRPLLPHGGRRLTVLVTGTVSDAHTWNLIYLTLVFQEMGHHVVTLGSCVPAETVAARCTALSPDLVVVSSVNGHGYLDGLRLIGALREAPGCEQLPAVIGGKLGIDGRLDSAHTFTLLEAGYQAVFGENGADSALVRLHEFVDRIALERSRPELTP